MSNGTEKWTTTFLPLNTHQFTSRDSNPTTSKDKIIHSTLQITPSALNFFHLNGAPLATLPKLTLKSQPL